MRRHVFAAIMAVPALVILFSPAWLPGQQATTSLSGTISDASGALVPGATVTISRGSTGEVRKTTASAHGLYRFEQLDPGTWTITVNATGFGNQTKVAELLVSNPATVDFKMTLEAVSQTVDVTAQTVALNTSDATLGSAVNNATIQALPMEDRTFPTPLSLQPGVLYLGHNIDSPKETVVRGA